MAAFTTSNCTPGYLPANRASNIRGRPKSGCGSPKAADSPKTKIRTVSGGFVSGIASGNGVRARFGPMNRCAKRSFWIEPSAPQSGRTGEMKSDSRNRTDADPTQATNKTTATTPSRPSTGKATRAHERWLAGVRPVIGPPDWCYRLGSLICGGPFISWSHWLRLLFCSDVVHPRQRESEAGRGCKWTGLYLCPVRR